MTEPKKIKTITLDRIGFDTLTGSGIMDVRATLRIGGMSYSYLSIEATIGDEIKTKIIGLIEDELGRQLEASPGTRRSPAHREMEPA